MVVTCDHCGARYRLNEGRITGPGARITCPKCRHVFVVYHEAEALPPLEVHKLDFRSVGIRSWKVKVAIGLVYDFSDYRTLQKYIKDGRVTMTDNLSHDGKTWAEVGSFPDLAQHFIEVYRAAERAQVAESDVTLEEADDAESLAEAIAEAGLDEAEAEDEVEVEAEVEVEDEAEIEIEIEDDAPAAVDVNVDQLANDLLEAVEAASEAEANGIDLDMDALLEDVAPRAKPGNLRRASEQLALSSIPATGNSEASDHQFVDPFEALKQQRGARTRSRPGPSKKKRKADMAAALKQRKQRVLVVAAVLLAGGYFVMDQMPEATTTDAVIQAGQRAAAQANAKTKKHAESVRKRMQADLNAALETVKTDDVGAFRVEEDQLMVRVPAGARGGAGAAGALPPGMGSGQPAGVDQRASSANDLVALGNTAARNGRWGDAADAYRRALQMDPSSADTRARHGRALYKQGDVAGAQGELRQAAGAGSSLAHKILGHLAREHGDDSGAIAHYQTYLRSGPSDSASIQALIQQITN
jgi:predicted Zn finger-like uncharacterized protein